MPEVKQTSALAAWAAAPSRQVSAVLDTISTCLLHLAADLTGCARAQVIKASLGPLPFVAEDADGEEAGANGAEPAAAPRPPPPVRSGCAVLASRGQWALHASAA